jgi:hypothetical protein
MSATRRVSLRGLCARATPRRTRELTGGLLDAIAGLMVQADCETHSRKGASMSSEPDAPRAAQVTGGSMRERHRRYSSDSRTDTLRPCPGPFDQKGTR